MSSPSPWHLIEPFAGPVMPVKNTFIDVPHEDEHLRTGSDPKSASDSEVVKTSAHRCDSPVPRPASEPEPSQGDFGALSPPNCAASPEARGDPVAESDGASQLTSRKKTRLGKRERQELKELSQRTSPALFPLAQKAQIARDKASGALISAWCHVYCLVVTAWANVRSTLEKEIKFGVVIGVLCIVIGVGGLAAAVYSSGVFPLNVRRTSPETTMVEHSEWVLNKGDSNESEASVAVLQDKLQFSQMSFNIDTQVFKVSRSDVFELLMSNCDLPEKICRSMALSAQAAEGQFHKKASVPLDENKGSYATFWMWVQSIGEDKVQVAYKAATLSYRLRDVVTYKDQVEEEPVIRCTQDTAAGWFTSTTTERCSQVSTKKVTTQLPVFKTAVMSPQEMATVDSMMDKMISKKVLENHQRHLAQGAGREVSSSSEVAAL